MAVQSKIRVRRCHLAKVVFDQVSVELLAVLPSEVAPVVWVDEGSLRHHVLREELHRNDRRATGWSGSAEGCVAVRVSHGDLAVEQMVKVVTILMLGLLFRDELERRVRELAERLCKREEGWSTSLVISSTTEAAPG